MTEIWRDVSFEGKWKNGKGHVVLSQIEYYNRQWIDLRIMNVQRPVGESQHTRHGVRLTLEQAEMLLPQLQEAIIKGKEESEKMKEEIMKMIEEYRLKDKINDETEAMNQAFNRQALEEYLACFGDD